ncbi:phage baseplate assembly protein V [Methanolobus sp. ZRKC3]|uniref:phage baseplate assembly protein V n=1 Tax=Methanolobus sp. ZRKC3 TaxID=3125786 RepID=UPI00324825D9
MGFGELFYNEKQQNDHRIAGVVLAVVTGYVDPKDDPEGLRKVKINFPWRGEETENCLARVASLMAGKERGLFFYPEIGDEVLVAFEQGNINYPYIIGALWNGENKPPEINSDGNNDIKLIRSRSGHTIKIDDTDGNEKIEIADKTEKNIILIDSKNNSISFKCDGDIEISAPNGKVTINAMDLELKSSASTKIEASVGVDLKASGSMNIKGATVNIN